MTSPSTTVSFCERIAPSLSSVGAGQPVGEEAILNACEATLALSVRTGHPHFFNQLIGRADVTGSTGLLIRKSVGSILGSRFSASIVNIGLRFQAVWL